MSKRVAILTTFGSYSEAYSLNRVVMDQIKMLVNGGYQPVVIVGSTFKPVKAYALPEVEIRTIPDVPVHNEVKKDPTFDQDVLAIEKALEIALVGVDVVLTHDIIYQPAALKHNLASRRVAKRNPNILWMHWIHSATSPYTLTKERTEFKDDYINLINESFPNSFYICFNDYSKHRIAQNFRVEMDKVKVVHHPTDIFDLYKFEPKSIEFTLKHNLLQADIICVYPIRLDRGKQVEKVAWVIGMMKKHFGRTVRMIVFDFHSTGEEKIAYRNDIKKEAEAAGLIVGQDIIFASEDCPEWRVEVPHEVIADMFRLSNVFIMASSSESYSLITQEAGLMGVASMINFDFPPFLDIFGYAPYWGKFSSNINMMYAEDGETTTNVTDKEGFYKNLAGKLIYEVDNNRAIILRDNLRKYRNHDYVFKYELEPCLYHSNDGQNDGSK